MLLRILGLGALVLAVASPALAQSLYSLTGGLPGTSIVTEFTGPPGGACAYPNGPVLAAFPTFVPFGCPTVGPTPAAPALLGDVAHDHVGDLVWATNGPLVTAYTPAGAVVASFATPAPLGPLTGLGFDSAGGILWMTDGALVMGVIPPGPGCLPPFVVMLPFPVPSPGPLTDLDWDPATGTLFACDAAGFVTNFLPGGALGPFGVFPVVGLCGPALVAPLHGLAVDTATPSVFGVPLTLTITDGVTINRILPPGGPSLPTFYQPFPCYPVPGAPIKGLAQSLHGITYGGGCHTAGGAPAMIGSAGNSTTPGMFTITLAGGPPGGSANLIFDLFAFCPPLAFKGCPVYTAPTFLIGPLPIPATGAIALPASIPPALPVGVGVYMQWICKDPGGGWALSPGLEFTLGLP